jgi:hypothetical protein
LPDITDKAALIASESPPLDRVWANIANIDHWQVSKGLFPVMPEISEVDYMLPKLIVYEGPRAQG